MSSDCQNNLENVGQILPFQVGVAAAGSLSEEYFPSWKSDDFNLHYLPCQAISNLMFEKGHNEPGLPSSGEQAETWSRRRRPFGLVIGATSPGGEISALALLPSHWSLRVEICIPTGGSGHCSGSANSDAEASLLRDPVSPEQVALLITSFQAEKCCAQASVQLLLVFPSEVRKRRLPAFSMPQKRFSGSQKIQF
jgi:hypothetical protein